MKYLIIKDKIKRERHNQLELRRKYLKSIMHNLDLNISYRNMSMILLNNLNRNSNSLRIKNRCVVTGTAKSVHRRFKMSRMKLREMALNGYLPGVTRSSW